MIKNIESIETLRRHIEEAESKKLGEQMMAFWKVFIHPDVEWADLLHGLDYPAVIAESAALYLHILTRTPRDVGKVVLPRQFWENVLGNAGINEASRIIDWVKGDQDLSDAWRKCQEAIQIIK